MPLDADGTSHVQGTVKPGFESVKQLYERELRTMAETNTQLCVYHKGECVVDLWSCAPDEPSFSPDSIVNRSIPACRMSVPVASV